MESAVDVILNTFDEFDTWLSLAFMLVAIFFPLLPVYNFPFFSSLFLTFSTYWEKTKNAQASNRAEMENSNLLYTLIYMLIQYNE